MTTRTDYERTVDDLDERIESMLDDQVLDEDRPDYGGYFSEDVGFASPSNVGWSKFLRLIGFGYLVEGSAYHGDEEILDRIRLAAAFQRRCQRDSGRIDLSGTNFDSAPDTAFTVSGMAPVVRLAAESDAPGADEVVDCLRPYLVSAAHGIAGAGFHTPNHRWVIVDALSQVQALFPDESFEDEIERYLSEGIDINPDGEYSERSTVVYNSVVNRRLIRAARTLDRPELLDPVRENLHCMADLLRDDWTIVTSVSHRGDRGRRAVPTKSTDSFYYVARYDDDDRLKAVASELLDRGGWPETLLEFFVEHPEWRDEDLASGSLDTRFTREMADSGIWRTRDDKLTATVATETTNAFELSYGDVALSGLRVHAPYFAGAKFSGEDIEFHDSGAKLRLTSEFLLEQLPGYWHPMDREVEWEELPYHTLDERDVTPRPEFDVFLDVERDGTEFDVTVRTEDGMTAVPFVVEWRFLEPDRVVVGDTSVAPALDDEPVLHGSGEITVVDGDDAITISGGFLSHRQTDTPAADDSGPVLRVAMTDWSPVDRTVSVRCHEHSFANDDRTARGPASEFGDWDR